jgi:hypothetical protein
MRSGFLFPIAVLLVCGCTGAEPAIVPPDTDPVAAGAQAIRQYDANSDGAIAGPELDHCPGIKAGLSVIDKDNDQRVTAAEIEARLRAYQTSGSAITFVGGPITFNGRPLVGATVTLVPEAFMGPAVMPATCVSDSNGYCTFKIDGEEILGAHCAIYRIEVSKRDASGNETVPARYNSQTVLGADIGVQSPCLYDLGLKLTSQSPSK